MSSPIRSTPDKTWYFIFVDPEDKTPGVLCRIMNTINYFITERGGTIKIDSYDRDYTTGKMSFTLENVADPDEALCYISSFPEVRFF